MEKLVYENTIAMEVDLYDKGQLRAEKMMLWHIDGSNYVATEVALIGTYLYRCWEFYPVRLRVFLDGKKTLQEALQEPWIELDIDPLKGCCPVIRGRLEDVRDTVFEYVAEGP